MSQNIEIQETARIDALFEKVSALINQARIRVSTAINVAEVYTKYHIGQYIVDDEQRGKAVCQIENDNQCLSNSSAVLTKLIMPPKPLFRERGNGIAPFGEFRRIR